VGACASLTHPPALFRDVAAYAAYDNPCAATRPVGSSRPAWVSLSWFCLVPCAFVCPCTHVDYQFPSLLTELKLVAVSFHPGLISNHKGRAQAMRFYPGFRSRNKTVSPHVRLTFAFVKEPPPN
jgi:hypothetical protein